MSTQEDDHYSAMKSDLKVKDASFFAGTWGEQAKWPRLLVFCDSDIPLTLEKLKESNAGQGKVPLSFFPSPFVLHFSPFQKN